MKVPDDTPLDVVCVIGCAVQTGVGAVLNTARVEPGATVLVLGLGGIGQSVVQGARVAGASRIIGSDPVPARREAALRLGATDVIDPGADDVAAGRGRSPTSDPITRSSAPGAPRSPRSGSPPPDPAARPCWWARRASTRPSR